MTGRTRFLGIWLLCAVIGLVLAGCFTPLLAAGVSFPVIFFGWALAGSCGLLGMLLKRHAMGGGLDRFFRIGVLADMARLGGFALALVCVRMAAPEAFEGIAVAAVVAVLPFVGGEIAAVWRV